jgi:hypothetical protein
VELFVNIEKSDYPDEGVDVQERPNYYYGGC